MRCGPGRAARGFGGYLPLVAQDMRLSLEVCVGGSECDGVVLVWVDKHMNIDFLPCSVSEFVYL